MKAKALLAGLLAMSLLSLVAAPTAEAAPLGCGVWNLVPSPNAGTSDNILYGVGTISANNVWAVGEVFNSSAGVAQTLTEQWNGANWTVISSPNVGASFNILYGVAAVSANTIWAVGEYYNLVYGSYQTLTLEWDGISWTYIPALNNGFGDNTLSGVARVPGSSTVWAVGSYYNSTIGSFQTLIEQWNGSSWQVVPSPNLGPAFNELLGVTAISANNVWAVGDYNHSQTLSEHWNGSSWKIIPSPSPSGSSYTHLSSVSAVSANNVWAVGNSEDSAGNARTLSEHWNGSSWKIVPSPGVSPTFNVFYGAARVAGSTTVWAVGDDNNSTPAAQTLTAFHC